MDSILTELGASWPREECHLLNHVCAFSGSSLCAFMPGVSPPIIELGHQELPLGIPVRTLRNTKGCLLLADGVIRNSCEGFSGANPAPEIDSWTDRS